jgi:TonB family protein
MTRFTPLVMACVRWWTRLYTRRLPPAIRDARREEIESDLWESSHDGDMTHAELAIQMVMRLMLGIPDDLAWRAGQLRVPTRLPLRSLMAAAVLCTLLLFAALFQLTTEVPRPPGPPAALLQAHGRLPDPPPPPPPPGARPGWKPNFQYGRTSYSVVTEGARPVLIKVQPIYPPMAVWGGLEGLALVQATVTNDGRVINAEVAPSGILGQSALHAIQRWEFAAAPSGRQRPALLTVRVTFGGSPMTPVVPR